jgi:hypothetical protein
VVIVVMVVMAGNAVHQHGCALVASTMPHENAAPHCEQWLIFRPAFFHQITIFIHSWH